MIELGSECFDTCKRENTHYLFLSYNLGKDSLIWSHVTISILLELFPLLVAYCYQRYFVTWDLTFVPIHGKQTRQFKLAVASECGRPQRSHSSVCLSRELHGRLFCQSPDFAISFYLLYYFANGIPKVWKQYVILRLCSPWLRLRYPNHESINIIKLISGKISVLSHQVYVRPSMILLEHQQINTRGSETVTNLSNSYNPFTTKVTRRSQHLPEDGSRRLIFNQWSMVFTWDQQSSSAAFSRF